MMNQEAQQCPQCNLSNTYFDGSLWNCSECFHAWIENKKPANESLGNKIIDAHGNELEDGDSVTIIKDLKVKGSSSSVKMGTKVKNIKITDAQDGHNISCKVTGFGSLNLKSEFVKKS